MRYIIFILGLYIMFSCNNDDNSNLIDDIPETNKYNIYKFSNNFTVIDQKYYKGDDGKEFTLEADAFFKNQWSFFNNPSIKTININKDSIIINENLSVKKFKYTKEDRLLYINNGENIVVIGYIDVTTNYLSLYKNYQSSLIIKNKDTNETLYTKESNYGKVSYTDIFPKILSSPKALNSKNEYIFWSNIEYKFIK